MVPNVGETSNKEPSALLVANIRHQDSLLPHLPTHQSDNTMAKDKTKPVEFKREKADPNAPRPLKRSEQAGFSQTPRAVKYKKGLSVYSHRVVDFLYDHMKPGTNEASGGIETIAQEMDISRASVVRAIKELYRHHIIMNITRMPNSRGGYFHVYHMRVYDYPSLRETGRLIKFDKPQTDAQQTAESIKKKVAKGKLPITENPKAELCSVCNGTGLEYVKEFRASRPCTGCRKQTG